MPRSTQSPSFFCIAVLIFILISRSGPARAQDVSSTGYHNFIFEDLELAPATTIVEDQQGFIWIATYQGLFRYDGHSFKAFLSFPGDSTGLAVPKLWDLIVASDGRLWIATDGGGINIYDPASETFEYLQPDPDKPEGLTSSVIYRLMEDSHNRIWVTTRGGGLYRIDPETYQMKRYTHDPTDPASISNDVTCGLLEDNGYIWVGTLNGGLNKLDTATGKFTHFRHDPDNPYSLSSDIILDVEKDHAGNLWVTTFDKGVNVRYRGSERFVRFFNDADHPDMLTSNRAWGVFQDSKKRIWISTNEGVDLFHPENNAFEHFTYDPVNPYTIPSNTVQGVFEDSHGDLWFGGRLAKLDDHTNRFSFLSLQRHPVTGEMITNHGVRSILKDRDGTIWIGAVIAGLFRYHPATDSLEHLTHPRKPAGLISSNIHRLFEDTKGNIWIGTYLGLSCYRPERKIIEHIPLPSSDRRNAYLRIGPILEDSTGTIWIGTDDGIFGLSKSGDITYHFPYAPEGPNPIGTSVITRMVLDDYENLWFGGEDGGLHRLDPARKQVDRYVHDSDDPNSLAGDFILGMNLSKNGDLLIATIQGLDRLHWNPSDDRPVFQHLTQRYDCFRHIRISDIIHTEKDSYWLLTSKGLMFFDEKQQTCRSYAPYEKDHPMTSRLDPGRDGNIYFGDTKGVYWFHPDDMQPDTTPPPVVATDFRLFNRSVPVRRTPADTMDFPSPLERSIRFTEAITLDHWQNDFAFEFAALNYTRPEMNQYQYKLEGYNEEWVPTTAEQPIAPYTNIPPGKYTFRIIASNNEGYWNREGAAIQITILAPWYWSWWSKPLYGLLLLGLLYTFYNMQLRRRLALAEAERVRELDAFKTRFFTNITHEFRTPLTVLLGMADRVTEAPEEWFHEGMTMIKRQGRQLLRLVNQLLDLRKLEAGKLELKMVHGDVLPYLRYLKESFDSFAESKDIRLHFITDLEEVEMDYDPQRLQEVVTNLMSNALKFTPMAEIFISQWTGKPPDPPPTASPF